MVDGDAGVGDAVAGEALTEAGSAPADAGSAPSDVGSAPVDAGSARADAADSAAVEEVVLPESPLGLAALIEAAVVKLAAAPLGLVSDADCWPRSRRWSRRAGGLMVRVPGCSSKCRIASCIPWWGTRR